MAKRLETPNIVTHPRRPESPHIIFATELYSATNNVLYSEGSPLTTLTPMNLSSSLWFIPASCNGTDISPATYVTMLAWVTLSRNEAVLLQTRSSALCVDIPCFLGCCYCPHVVCTVGFTERKIWALALALLSFPQNLSINDNCVLGQLRCSWIHGTFII